MNRKKLSLRRPLGILGAALLGVTAAVALASPASAHHSTVAGSVWCNPETGNWDITWTVDTVVPPGVDRFQLTSVELTPAGTTVTNIAAATDPEDFPYHTDATLYGHQLLPGDTTAKRATLKVKAKWDNGFEEKRGSRGTVKIEGTCEKEGTPPTPTPAPEVTAPNATFAAACDGTVDVTLINGEDATVPAELTVSAKGFTETHTVEPNSEKKVAVPAGAGKITVTQKGEEEPVTEPYTWERPENCGEPALAYASTCEEFLFEVTNPADGAPITVTFTPSTGDAQTITVAPDEAKVVKFPASEGLTVTPSADGVEGEPIAWQPEEDCAGGSGGGDGGSLPVTGVAAGGIAGGALVLLAIGAVLFFVARRRRTTFTA